MRLHAIADACPHVAIGSLAQGDACVLADLEDLAVVSCPVHTFAFDLSTGHCVTDKRRKTPAASVYSTRIWRENDGSEVVQISTMPRKAVENVVSIDVGNRAQLRLVEIALRRKFGDEHETE
jgi:nitrite reductase/ring-hydroxylating ferredoxin subunit